MGTKFSMKGMSFSQTPGIGAHLARQAVASAQKNALPTLTKEQIKNMTPEQIEKYNAKRARVNNRLVRKTQRYGRRAAKLDQSLELKQAQLVHGTIRQGLAELAGIGSEGVGGYAITKGVESANAVKQNTSGGMKDDEPDTESVDVTGGNGPVARGAKRGRREE